MRRTTLAIVSVLVLGLALVAAGCGGKKGSSSSSASTGESASAEGGATAEAAACTPAKMETHSPETLTIATDKPAYPPYFENDEPENGEGFEGAVLHRQAGRGRAGRLGSVESQVAGRTEGNEVRRPDQHHQPQSGRRIHRTVEQTGSLQQLGRRRHGAQERPGGR